MQKDEDHSFNEAMNEWAAKQSFFQNPRNRIIHPDPSLPTIFRIIGYLFRLAIVGMFGVIVMLFAMKKYVGGESFGTMMADKIGALLQADDYEGRRYSWKGNRATTKLFSAVGSEEAFYKDLKAVSISFNMPKSALFGKSWKIDDLDIGELEMTLRVGRSSDTATSGIPTLDRLPFVAAGFGIDPDLEKLRYDFIEVAHTNLRWGVSKTTRGSIIDAPMEIVPDPEGWKLSFKGGTLSQNWWNGVKIESLDLQTRDDKLLFSNAKFELARGGSATLAGEMSLGAVPQADLQMNISEGDIAGLIPPAFHRYLGGRANATVAISGSPNTRSGLAADTTLEFVGARMRNIPAFEALSLLLETSRIRHLPLTSGTVQFETSDSEWRVTELNAICEGVGVLRGSFTVSEKESKKEPGIGLPDGSEAAVPELPIEERWIFDGKLQLGIDSKKLGDVHPLAKTLFEDDGSGTSWIELVLDGPITEITSELHDSIISGMRR